MIMSDVLIQSWILLVLVATGASMGSWLYLLAERLPKQESTLFKRSHCPVCNFVLPIRSLIPILSWVIQKGRCLQCRTPIPKMYFLVEGFTALGTVLIFWFYHRDLGLYFLFTPSKMPRALLMDMVIAFWLFYSSIPLFFTDVRHFILPDQITIPGIFVSLFLGIFHPKIGFISSFLGALIGGGLFFATSWGYLKWRGEEGLGLGDVKYITLIGGALGIHHLFWVFFFSCLSGSIIGLTKGIITGDGLKTCIPFGPFLSFGALVTHFLRPFL
jgi:leader peptidase (prepilin peptidase)/N-methyltransferase